MKTFNNLVEMQPYYDKDTNTYDFMENGLYFEAYIAFDLSIDSNIKAWNIKAQVINALDINAWNISAHNIKALNIDAQDIKAYDINACNIDALNIRALDINAQDISFYAVCFAYNTFVCKSITGRRENAKYFCLDSEVIIKKD